MITRTTLKAVWLAGGGVLATWVAVSPNHDVPPASSPAVTQAPAATSEIGAEDLNAQADRLRERTHEVTLRPSTRNPFRFREPRSAAPPGNPPGSAVGAATVEPSAPAVPLRPSLTLSGIAEKKTADGVRRTAVLSGDRQIYWVGEGDSVAGRYTVVTIDPEAVLLRDATGVDLRLVLR